MISTAPSTVIMQLDAPFPSPGPLPQGEGETFASDWNMLEQLHNYFDDTCM